MEKDRYLFAMVKCKRTKGQAMIYKTSHRKLEIEQQESHQKYGMNLGAPEGYQLRPLLKTLLCFNYDLRINNNLNFVSGIIFFLFLYTNILVLMQI